MNLRIRKIYLYLVYVLILIGPIIDLATGYVDEFVGMSSTITPGVIIRGGLIFPLMLYFSIKNKSRYIFLFYICFLIVTISLLLNTASGHKINITSSLSLLFKIIFPFLGFATLKYIHENKSFIKYEVLWKLVYYYGLLTVISVIFFTALGVNLHTYSHQSYTSTGLFGAANDISLILLISYCCFLYYNETYQENRYTKLIVVTLLYLAAVFLISTRASIIGIPTAFFLFIGYKLISTRKELSLLNKLSLSLIIVFFVVIGINAVNYLVENNLIYAINRLQSLASGEFLVSGEFEGRRRVPQGVASILNFNFGEHLFGAGDVRFALVENDIVDIYGKFGLPFLIMIYSASIYFLIRIYKIFFLKKSLASLSLSMALTFYIIHGSLAGHAFTSAQVNSLIMVIYFLIYLYSRKDLNQIYLHES